MFAIIILMFCSFSPCVFNSTAAQSNITISVDSGRPLAEAILELEKQTGLSVTYEDPPYMFREDIADVTESVRRDLGRYPPGQAPRVLVPKGGKFEFSHSVTVSERPIVLIRQLVAAYHTRFATARFRVEQSDGLFNVVPVSIRNSSGHMGRFNAPLDVRITVEKKTRTAWQALEELCAAVARSTGTRIGIGTTAIAIPAKPLENYTVSNMPARLALAELLAKIGNGAKLSWRLLYGPDTRTYVLNIHAVS